MNRLRFCLLFPLFLAALAGCSSLRRDAPPLADGFSAREFAKADAGSPLAVSRNGALATVSKKSVLLLDGAGVGRELAEGGAYALCFSPGGNRLAAALPAGDRTFLRLFDREGKVVGEATIPERVTSLAWRSETQLLASALAADNLAPDARLTSRLYLWDGSTPPAATVLNEVPLSSALAKLSAETIFGSLSLAVSPYGDEIAYGSLNCPPVFAPCQTITVRHLESGRERVVGKTAPGSGGPVYLPDGESLLVGETRGLTRRLSIPDGRELEAWPSPGNRPAVSPSGDYLFLDGSIYRNGRTVFSLPTGSQGVFLPDGSGLAISYGGKIYLITGFKDRGAPEPPADLDRLLRLRRLRSLGLISEREYRGRKAGLP